MTKDEAIIQLQGMVVGAEWLSPYMVEALDMAIEALKRTSNAFPTHECVNPTHEPSRAHELKERRHKSCPMQEVNSRRKGVANDEIRTNFNAAAII